MRVVFADFEAFSHITIRPKSYAVTVRSKLFPEDVFAIFRLFRLHYFA